MQVAGGIGSMTIDKDWLKGQKDNETNYQKCVKQAMCIAAAQVRMADSLDPLTKKEECQTGTLLQNQK